MKLVAFITLIFLVSNSFAEFEPPRPTIGPAIYKDEGSGVLFYVESDGRHVSAISPEGKLLWTRDPFIDGKLKSYRYKAPLIIWIGEPHESSIRKRNGRYIGIQFNSSQFGIMNFKNGHFTFLGQD